MLVDLRFTHLALLLACAGCAAPSPSPEPAPLIEETASTVERPEWERHFRAHGAYGTFVLYDFAADRFEVYNPARADSAFSPASTFKIPNSLIALDAGAVADVDEVLPWDGEVRWLDAWNQDHSMRTALPASVVWFYQEMARRVGPERMQAALDGLGYGSADISSGIDTFWLGGSLQITPIEQARFLRRLYDEDVPFAPETIAQVKEILTVEETDEYVVHAKTGWAAARPGTEREIGWYVGLVERAEGAYAFALNIDIEDGADGSARRAVAEVILRERGLLSQ